MNIKEKLLNTLPSNLKKGRERSIELMKKEISILQEKLSKFL